MSTSFRFSSLRPTFQKHHCAISAAGLRSLCLSILLVASCALAAQDDQPAEEKPRSIVAVFRLEGPINEVPTDDLLEMFSAPGTSLRELVASLNKAATD